MVLLNLVRVTVLGQHHLGDRRIERAVEAIIEQFALLLLRDCLEDVGKFFVLVPRPIVAGVTVNADFAGQTGD